MFARQVRMKLRPDSVNRMENPEVAKSLLGVIEGSPKVEIFEVIDSTFFCFTSEGIEGKG